MCVDTALPLLNGGLFHEERPPNSSPPRHSWRDALVAVYAWNSVDVEMSIHGYIAMILGIIFSLVIGCGPMALMFYSSRHGYDDIDRH